ncbi:MAG: 16S rRNA (guanine(527)-N(7))-methyltransferase RsmG [Gammaproteobacteria bacterium]|nr:16S rRNA (guanine(527)-N(7))-methyltransferase RsmG [Gammaproteobacteria bacterium]
MIDAEAQRARWRSELDQGLGEMRLALDNQRQGVLVAYLALLMKWNRAYNLTAVRDPVVAVSRQLLDSLAVLPLLSGTRMLDLGSGAGLPGIPVAIARPDVHVTLLDANSKKCRFMEQAKLELQLANISVVCARVERFQPDCAFDLILSRAFAALPEIFRLASHLLKAEGGMLALKGKVPHQELVRLADQGVRSKVFPLKVAGTEGSRTAVRLWRDREGESE